MTTKQFNYEGYIIQVSYDDNEIRKKGNHVLRVYHKYEISLIYNTYKLSFKTDCMDWFYDDDDILFNMVMQDLANYMEKAYYGCMSYAEYKTTILDNYVTVGTISHKYMKDWKKCITIAKRVVKFYQQVLCLDNKGINLVAMQPVIQGIYAKFEAEAQQIRDNWLKQ